MQSRLVLLIPALIGALESRARASDWYVDANASPGGDGSAGAPFVRIGDAIGVAVDDDRVFIAPATYQEAFTPAASIELHGTGARPGDTILTMWPPVGIGPVLIVPSGVRLVLQNMQISHSFSFVGTGGGITNHGTLFLNDCVVRDCVSYASGFGHGDAKAQGGGIFNDGSLTLVDCTVADNECDVYAQGTERAFGGGIANLGELRLESCTIAGNVAHGSDDDDGYAEGGGIWSSGALELVNCTVSGNSLKKRTVHGGGIYQTGAAAAVLRSCTIADNLAESDYTALGGGLHGTFTADHTIVADNSLAGNGAGASLDFEGTLDSLGYVLIGEDDGMTKAGDESGNLYDVDPLLDPLADNGGPVLTHALGSGSPAIDSGNPDPTPVVANDARRFGRARIARHVGIADRGAVEIGASPALDLRATPDRDLAVDDPVTIEVRQGVAGAPFAVFVVAIDDVPVFVLELLDVLDAGGAFVERFLVPNDPSLLGATVVTRAFAVDGLGKLARSPEEPLRLQ